MAPRNLVTKNCDSLYRVFRQYPVIAFAYLFGSQATGEQSALSDIDVAIYIDRGAAFTFDDKLHFHGECCRTLKRNDVDVVVLNDTKNLILLEQIIRHGKLIYNISQQQLDEFELKILHLACDFRTQRYREMGV